MQVIQHKFVLYTKPILCGTVAVAAGDDSHLHVVPAGNLQIPFCAGVFAELRRVNTSQRCPLVGARVVGGPLSPPSHKQQGNTLKTTRHTTAKSILQSVDTWVVGQDTLGVLSGCSDERTISLGQSDKRRRRPDQNKHERYDPVRLNPRRERRSTLVSRRDNTVSLGCSGYREDTSGRAPARHGRPC
jgi:hypothetical protein